MAQRLLIGNSVGRHSPQSAIQLARFAPSGLPWIDGAASPCLLVDESLLLEQALGPH